MTEIPIEREPGNHRWCETRIAELAAENAGLREEIAALKAQVEELKERLGQNSGNSSRPPSSNPPWIKSPPKKPSSGRKPGGQPGHDAHFRPLAPPERVNKRVVVKPKRCPCGGRVRDSGSCPDRHQVAELPEIQAFITEYLLHSVICLDCGATVKAELPDGVPRGAFGPRLQAFVALLTGVYRLSKRNAPALLGDLLQLDELEEAVAASTPRTPSVDQAPPAPESEVSAVQAGSAPHPLPTEASPQPAESSPIVPQTQIDTASEPSAPERSFMSEASVVACERAVSEALAAPVAEAHAYVQAQPVGFLDDTAWRQGKKKAHLWVLVTPLVTVFLVHLRKNAEAVRELLGKFFGILVSDRAKAYLFWPIKKRQLCWAHLKRDFEAIFERRGASRRIGEALLKAEARLFTWWWRLREGKIQRSTFQRYVAPLRKQVKEILVQGAACPNEKTAGTCLELFAVFPAMWTFVDVEGVEPTNNVSEQSLRHAVILRKTSFGTQGEAGSRFIERILTAATTLKQQRRNVFQYLVAACEARLEGRPAPSLLPTVPALERLALAG